MKFKVGDKVVYVDDEFPNRQFQDCVVDYITKNGDGCNVIFSDGWSIGTSFCSLVRMGVEPGDSLRTEAKRCTCGAAHTSFPDFHADWCDL